MKFNKLILNTKTRAPSLLILFILLCFFLPFSVSADINSGLVGYWTMDGKDINWSTNTITDKSGNGNNGVITNMSTTTSPSQGHTGQSLKFDGVDDYISIPYASLDFERTDPFSISAWVKFDDTHAQSIIGRSSGGGSRGTFFYRCKNVSLCNANGIAFALGNSGANAIVVKTPTDSFLPNVWTHVVVTYDGSSSASGVKIYKNAVSLSLTTSLDTLSATIKPAVNWRIGDDYTNDWMKGPVDEVRIYNRALSSQDVAQLYKQGQSKIAQPAVRPTTDSLSQGLVGYWTMDGKDINWGTNQVTDKSGNGNTGTITNMSTTTSPSQGHTGQSLKFDGVDDYVITAPISFDTTIYTVSAWLYPTNLSTRNTFFSFACNGGTFNGSSLEVGNGVNANAVHVDTNAYWTVTNTNSVTQNAWNHIVVIKNGNGATAAVYINGVAQALSVNSAYNGTSGSYNRCIGARDTGLQFFNGKIDETRLYNRVLSAQEIAQLYKIGQSKIAQPAVRPTADALSQGLVGYWTMDGKDVSGTTVTDRSGQGNNGTAVNTPDRVMGKVGQALNFYDKPAHDNGYVSIGDPVSGALDFGTGDFSLSFWMKGRGFVGHGSSVNIAVNKAAYDGMASGYAMHYGSDDKMVFAVWSGATPYALTAPTATTNDNKWHLYTGVLLSSNIYLYVDGQLVAGPVATSGSISTATGLMIAGDGTFLNPRTPSASVDEVRIYNRAFSAREISQLYKQGQSRNK